MEVQDEDNGTEEEFVKDIYRHVELIQDPTR